MMTPYLRNLANGSFRFVLVTLLTCVLLLAATLAIAASIAWFQDGAWQDPQRLSIGFVCGLIVLLFIASFHLRRETQTIAYSQREQFLAKAKSVLREMGYVLLSQRANVLVFRPGFHSYLFGGGIQIDAGEQEAKVAGPKIGLDLFRRSYRLFNHMQRVQQYLQDHRKFTENVLKRVELRLRLEPEQLEAVRVNVVGVLKKKGIVICELNLLVQSDMGIPEDVIEFQVREWLEQNGIDADIHKDVIQFIEVVPSDVESETVTP